MPKITKRLIDTLRPDANGAEVFRWDSELRGFGVRIMPSGVASYHIQYRTPEGRTRRMAIGRVGTLTPDEARRSARERLSAAANGSDPSTERRAVRNAMTVSELCDRYLAHAKGQIKGSTLAMDKSRIETHVAVPTHIGTAAGKHAGPIQCLSDLRQQWPTPALGSYEGGGYERRQDEGR
jgi:Arm DNA-binding domain